MSSGIVARRENWRAWAAAVARAAGDFLFPPVCPLCDRELPADAGPRLTRFCIACQDRLLKTSGLACLRCGASIGPHLDPAVPCDLCRHERFVFERVLRIGVYDDALRSACLRAKNPGGESTAAALAGLLWDCALTGLHADPPDVVVPIPRYWLERIVRHSAAAETMAACCARRLQAPLASAILTKRRYTRSQARSTPAERRGNLKGVFAVADPRQVAGLSVLVVDDVMTTGTTANEAAKTLIRSGAARVIVAVAARGVGARTF